MSNDQLLSKIEARKALGGIGNTKFYALLRDNTISGVKLGKRLMIRRSEIDRYISSLPPAFEAKTSDKA